MRLHRHTSLTVLVLWCVFCSSQARAQETPEETASAYYGAIGDGDWSRVAALTHPRELDRLRAIIVAVVEELRDTTELGRFNSFANTRADALAKLSVGDLAQLNRLPPATVYERFLAGDEFLESILSSIENDAESDFLGHLSEGDSLAHVVRRARFTGLRPERPVIKVLEWDEASRMDVLTLRRDGDVWRVVTDTGYPMYLAIRSMLTN